jgi:hypothetical protein
MQNLGRLLRMRVNLSALDVNLQGNHTRQSVASKRIPNSIIDAHDPGCV